MAFGNRKMKKRRELSNLFLLLVRAQYVASDYRSFFGILWSFMAPLATFTVIYFIFVDRLGRHIHLFPLKLLTSVIVVHYFTAAAQCGMRFLKSSREIILNTTTPSEILIVPTLFMPTLKFCVGILLCLGLSIAHGLFNFAYLPLFILLCVLYYILVVGFALILAVLSCLAGDIEEIWVVVARIMLFITPVFYTLDMLSDWARPLVVWLNPLTPIMLAFQSLITGARVPYFGIANILQSGIYPFAVFAFGYFIFKKFEKRIIDDV